MPRLPWNPCAVFALALLAGCANLTARKVPLDARLSGKDRKYNGFRYYLPRPYLVVSERVCVGHHIISGKLMQNKAGTLFVQTPRPDGHARHRARHGQDRTPWAAADPTLTYVTYEPPVAPSAPPLGGKQATGGEILGTPPAKPPKPDVTAPPATAAPQPAQEFRVQADVP